MTCPLHGQTGAHGFLFPAGRQGIFRDASISAQFAEFD